MASNLTIVEYGKPVLRQKGEKITSFDAALREFTDAMVEALHKSTGIGLAAQQVGKALQICVIDTSVIDEKESSFTLDGKQLPQKLIMPLVLINPVVKLGKGEKVWFDEGCLSFPEIRADVERPDSVEVHYQDTEGAEHHLVCSGVLARVVQHETDHLNGILFIDRAPKRTVKKIWAQLEALRARNS